MKGSVSEQLQSLLGQADRDTIPSGVLVWWGAGLLPDGSGRANGGVPVLNQTLWNAGYTLLRHGALPGVDMPPPQALTAPLLQSPQDGVVPLALAHFRYARPKKKVADAIEKAASNGKPLSELPSDLGSAVKEKTAFMAKCVLAEQWARDIPVVRARQFQILMERGCYLRTPGIPDPDEIVIDAGGGPQRVYFGDRVTCRVDEGTEAALCHNIARLGNRYTIVAITHRPAWRALATRLYEVNGGEVTLVEQDKPHSDRPAAE